MLLGYGLFGYDIGEGSDSKYLPDLVISSISFGSNGNGTVIDKVWGRDGFILSEQEFNTMFADEYTPSWTDDTFVFADFNSDFLNAGEIQASYPCQFTSYTLRKVYTSLGKTYDVVVANDIPGDDTSYKDYTNSRSCQYYLTVNGQNSGDDTTVWCAPMNYSDEVTQTPWGYYLIDVENDVSYFFNINVSGGTQTFNSNSNQYAMNQSADNYYHGYNDMKSGDFTGILYENNQFSDNGNTVDVLIRFREFFNSKRKCMLKDRWGNVFNVILTEYSEQYLNIYLPNRVIGSTVAWKEVQPDE